MRSSPEYVATLQYMLKAAEAQLAAFKSGEKYVRMEQEFRKQLREKDAIMKRMEQELACSRRETVAVRNQWFAIFEDMQKESDLQAKKYRKEIEKLNKKLLKAEKKNNDLMDKVTQQRRHIYKLETELEDEKGKNLKLRAQLNRDYENSSIPSSKAVHRKKISNSREKTGRKPGGQPGHKGHHRKKQIPTTDPVLLPPPAVVLEDPCFRKTGKTIVKQLIQIRTVLEVTEYHADVYYNSKTCERIHAEFPHGLKDDVNYGGSIKAFLFLLNNDCCVSIDKSRKFLSDLTGGKLRISKGMINKLSREFPKKQRRQERNCTWIFSAVLSCIQMQQMPGKMKVTGHGTGKCGYCCRK